MIITKRIESIDGVLNRTLVAKDIVEDLCDNGAIDTTTDFASSLSKYVEDFLVGNFTLLELLGIEKDDIVCRVYEEITTNFINSHDFCADYDFDSMATFFEDCGGLNELFKMVFVDTEETERTFLDYVGIDLSGYEDEVLGESYDFHTNVEFEIHCEKNDDPNWVEKELHERIGKNAAYKWRAVSIVGFCAVYQTNRYVGIVNLVIHGNKSYTKDTIASAIHNRLGANAKRKAWNEFVITNINTDRV